jgi:hypothetical protein
VLSLSRPRLSFVLFLALIVVAGVLTGEVITAVGVAVFLFVLVSMDSKPAWKWFFDPPGDVDSGRSTGRFLTWRRAGETKPLYELPRDFPGSRPEGTRRASGH